MIFVNYGGGGYYFFGHATWNGKYIISTLILQKTKERDFEHIYLVWLYNSEILKQQTQQQGHRHTVYSQNRFDPIFLVSKTTCKAENYPPTTVRGWGLFWFNN